MSIFLCAICDNLKDSDDGGEELKPNHPTNYDLICADCACEREFKDDLKNKRGRNENSNT